MICNQILKDLKTKCVRAQAREHAINDLVAYIKKNGKLYTYEVEFKNMVLSHLRKELKIFQIGSNNQTTNQTYHKFRAQEIEKLITFIKENWRE